MNEDDKQLTLAQWQTCVEMANAVSQRRDMTNNLFATLHLAVVGAITAISSFSNFEACVICILGIIFCVAWICIIDNFRILNTQKFHKRVVAVLKHRVNLVVARKHLHNFVVVSLKCLNNRRNIGTVKLDCHKNLVGI